MKHLAVLVFAVALPMIPAPAVAGPNEQSFADAASSTVKDAAAIAWETTQRVSTAALGLIGVDYKFGGNSPETGLDCSGLVRYVFQQVMGIALPRTAKEMSHVGDRVALDELKPGDLVFFNTRRFAFSHVGIYLGDNRFVHAPSRGREVEIAMIDKTFWQHRFNGARRLVGTLPDFMPELVTTSVASPIAGIAAPVPLVSAARVIADASDGP